MMTPENLERIRRAAHRCETGGEVHLSVDQALAAHEHRADLLAEVDRLRKLFDDAGQGEHNVLALVEHYQTRVSECEDRISAAREILSANGCDCGCGHHYAEHLPDCHQCLACRIEEALRGVTP